MAPERGYASPKAFRQALTDRLKSLAAEGPWGLPELQRQIAYDRLLARLYLVDRDWIVKGATALLARELGVRSTIDVDLYRDTAVAAAERELRDAVTADLGDWFTFELGPARSIRDGLDARRVPIEALIGPTVWVSFHVDLVGAGPRMTGEPDEVPALARVGMPDVEQGGYRAYPLVDHITDKIVAIFGRYGGSGGPSTRYKDLVDLVAITRGASVEAVAQMAALNSEAEGRGLILPSRFEVPDRALWTRGYAAEARRSLLDTAGTLEEALEIVAPFVDPLLDGSAEGSWNPAAGGWSGGSESQPSR